MYRNRRLVYLELVLQIGYKIFVRPEFLLVQIAILALIVDLLQDFGVRALKLLQLADMAASRGLVVLDLSLKSIDNLLVPSALRLETGDGIVR